MRLTVRTGKKKFLTLEINSMESYHPKDRIIQFLPNRLLSEQWYYSSGEGKNASCPWTFDLAKVICKLP